MVATRKNLGIISYEEYHPYGTTSWWASNGSTDVSRKRYRYTGKERDDETGLGYHGARYYAAWLGRWERPDPIGLQGGVNRFSYVRNRPTSLNDPTGNADPEQEQSWGQYFTAGVKGFAETVKAGSAPVAVASKAIGGAVRDATAPLGPAIRGAVADPVGTAKSIGMGMGMAAVGVLGHTPAANAVAALHEAKDTTVKGVEGVVAMPAAVQDVASGDPVRARQGVDKAATSLANQAKLAGLVYATVEGAGAIKAALTDEAVTAGAAGIARGSGHGYARTVVPGGTGKAWAGHGSYVLPTDTTVVPSGTTVRFWGPAGKPLPDRIGLLVEQGHFEEAAAAAAQRFPGFEAPETFGPGSTVENYRLRAPDNLTIAEKSITVEDPTKLSDLMLPDMGPCDWAACRVYKAGK